MDIMDSMDLDVEMDADVDLVPDEPIIPESELPGTLGNRSPGEVNDDEDTILPTKIHLKGLDILNPEQVRAYVTEHSSEKPAEKIEWIDDSSANLIFASDEAAARALASLAAEPLQDVAHLPIRKLIPAKPFSEKPEITLQVRLAVATDKKQGGAASRSRFYLLNPEYDPEERRRQSDARKYRYRDGDNYGRRRTREPRDQDSASQFDVSLYDDDEATLASRVSQSRPRLGQSYTPDSDRYRRRSDSYRKDNRGKELFPDGSSGRNGHGRGRSASPARDRDDDRSMDDISSDGSAARNRDRARAIKSRLSRGDQPKELFPEKYTPGTGRLGDNVDDAATLLAKGIMLPLMDESSDTQATRGQKLEDGVTAPSRSKLASRISSPSKSAGSVFNIRGSASQRSSDQGFAIKGVAGKSARELFPEKFGNNAGKELFGERLEGRSRRRQRAGDLFD
ncbi:hypothetical protein F4779DRAFT_162440 [Xylariaceae sp. FL0662B]|nr:hypothetical protein F4779DRAFT_162440 [Xylariaceae sp. FL0662B]